MCKPVKFLHSELGKSFLYRPLFVQGGSVNLKLGVPSLNSYYNAGITVFCILCITGNKGPISKHEKQYQ